MDRLPQIIREAFHNRTHLTAANASLELIQAIGETLAHLDQGRLRVAEKISGQWTTHTWLKEAILLSFILYETELHTTQTSCYFDKIPLKFSEYDKKAWQQSGVRMVPPATVRQGAFIAPRVVLMPSFINIGAYVDQGTLVDTWATVGSCAQIGKNVHLSGGVGIGGVLEPLQSSPTVIEDDCFIGARSEIVEGVIVEAGSVISMGVFIGQSTPIYDRMTDTIHRGKVPAGSVVIPGTLPSSQGNCHLSAAIIVKKVDAKTREKVGINEILRGITV